MKKKEKMYEDLCTGCGLCSSYFGKELVPGEDGFERVKIEEPLLDFCREICPANGAHVAAQEKTVWGRYVSVYESHACDEKVRYAAASGGVTTAVAMYLLDKGYADGVIHVGEDPLDPYRTKVYCDKTAQEVAAHSASRYISAAPLSNLVQLLQESRDRYVFIGRPCDMITLKNFLHKYPAYQERICCTLSFFCAGTPSTGASRRLAEKLGVDASEVRSIRYRGKGWPGKATVTDKTGQEHQMAYIDSWNQILGKDIRKICKFCSDGVGEWADISNGDLWHMGEEGRPVFEEAPGVNVTIARTALGESILKDAWEAGYISLQDYGDRIKELELIQPNHAMKKKLLYPKILAMRLMHKTVPAYRLSELRKFGTSVSIWRKGRTFLGTLKRILSGRLE